MTRTERMREWTDNYIFCHFYSGVTAPDWYEELWGWAWWQIFPEYENFIKSRA